MPVKLSGELVEEARHSAALFHRSLTGQIEHWAALGRALEAQLPGESLAQLLQQMGGTMKIRQVGEVSQRQEVMKALADFLGQGAGDTGWLRDLSARGVPLYGTDPAHPDRIVRLDPDGSRYVLPAEREPLKVAESD